MREFKKYRQNLLLEKESFYFLCVVTTLEAIYSSAPSLASVAPPEKFSITHVPIRKSFHKRPQQIYIRLMSDVTSTT